MSPTPDPVPLRRRVYGLLITLAVAVVCGRILAVNRVYEPDLHRTDPGRSAAAVLLPLGAADPVQAASLCAVGNESWRQFAADEPPRTWPATRPEPMPTFGSNDRSRFATVRALVDEGTYVVGRRDPARATPKNPYGDYGIVFEPGWETLDKVLRPEPHDGAQEFFSSKPPLFATLVAGEYWLLKHALGWEITDRIGRWNVVRAVLLTVNALPLLIYLLVLSRLLDRLGTTDWGRLYVLAAACFGTFVTTFAVTLNNHTPAACCALFALAAALPAWERGSAAALCFALAGFFAALTATFELPAASFLALLFVLLLVRSPGRTLAFFVPAALLPAAAFLLTNYLAIGMLKPAYGEFGGPWYEYPGSHWLADPGQVKRGIDWAFQQEPRAAYVFHFLAGHHGVFSLTPVWLLALAGMVWGTWRLVTAGRRHGLRPLVWGGAGDPGAAERARLLVAGMALVLGVVVTGFYLVWVARWNYGGFTSGPRWLIWLTPLWLLALLPVADWLAARRWGRVLGYVLLGVSALSASYPAWNPWRHPWLYNLLEALGWRAY
jgi:energy-coupling factor transporter transmembrane protein EcfT